MADNGQADRKERSNGVIVGTCLAFVAGMIGMAYAAVPLYDMFCRVTGYNGTTQRVEQASDLILDEKIKVTFDANVAAGLPWEFVPVQRDIDVRIGETVADHVPCEEPGFHADDGPGDLQRDADGGRAYFNKVQCFCFTETTLEPGEEMEMPVVFFVDPEIVKPVETQGIKTLTLSYTFYPREPSKPVAQVKAKAENKL